MKVLQGRRGPHRTAKRKSVGVSLNCRVCCAASQTSNQALEMRVSNFAFYPNRARRVRTTNTSGAVPRFVLPFPFASPLWPDQLIQFASFASCDEYWPGTSFDLVAVGTFAGLCPSCLVLNSFVTRCSQEGRPVSRAEGV